MHPASLYEYRAMLRMGGPDCACLLHPVSRLLARCKYGTRRAPVPAVARSSRVFLSPVLLFPYSRFTLTLQF